MKKTKKVGIYSLGLALIFCGISIFLSLVLKKDIIATSIKFWPVLLIFLGLEIIYANKKNSGSEEYTIRIDFMSILIIIFLLVSNMGLWGVYEIGLVDKLRDEINYEDKVLNLEGKIEIDKDVEKVVLVGGDNLEVRYGDVQDIDYGGNLFVNGKLELGEEELKLKTRKSGEILYLDLDFNSRENSRIYSSNLRLRLPSNIGVEFKNGNDLKLVLDKIDSNILVDNYGGLNILFKSDQNLEILTRGEEDIFTGNIIWNLKEIDGSDPENPIFNGSFTSGDGKNKIRIINPSNNIEINRID